MRLAPPSRATLDALRRAALDAVRRGALAGQLVALALGLAAVAAFAILAADGTRQTFIFMGFDEDRAALLVGGVAAGLGGAVTALVGGRRATAALAGLVALGALFGGTYQVETVRAAGQTGIGVGQFSLGGWLLSTVALLVAGLLLGLATGVLGEQLRAASVAVVRDARSALRHDPRPDGTVPALPVGRVLVVAAIVTGLLVAAPVAGQLLNFGPDSLMLGGDTAAIPLVQSPAAMPLTGGSPSIGTPSIGPTPSPAQAGQVSAAYPWRDARTTGTGTVVAETLPAPWTGGSATVATVSVYLPPGYASATRRYPVIYEIPWAISLYDNGASVRPTLDQLMDSGAMPASIVVFLASNGGPFVDNECIDAAGNREWFDTFVGTTLVHFMDARFRTIPSPWARSLLGDSQGGFCAANVLLHHPDVFRQELSFSGYYLAAPLLHMTPSAQAPYAGDLALERANSPMRIISALPVAIRRELSFILVGNPLQAFYGAQLTAFAATARALGSHVTVIDTPFGHSWLAVRADLPAGLQAIGLRELAVGVFASG